MGKSNDAASMEKAERGAARDRMKAAAHAFRKMQARNIDVYRGFGAENGRGMNFFEIYGGTIDDYLVKHQFEDETDEEILALKTEYMVRNPNYLPFQVNPLYVPRSSDQENDEDGDSEGVHMTRNPLYEPAFHMNPLYQPRNTGPGSSQSSASAASSGARASQAPTTAQASTQAVSQTSAPSPAPAPAADNDMHLQDEDGNDMDLSEFHMTRNPLYVSSHERNPLNVPMHVNPLYRHPQSLTQSGPAPVQAHTFSGPTAESGGKKKKPEGSQTHEDKLEAHLAETELYQEIEEDNPELNRGIDPAAMQAMQAISQWMLRNCVKSGVFQRAKSADEHMEYVHSNVLKKPARLKLYAYYMIEKGKRKETDPEKISANIAESQLDYVPNLEEFKNKMVATKWKFWKRLTSDAIYWNKLQEAFFAAGESQEQIKPFGNMSTTDISGDVSAPSAGNQEQTADSSPAAATSTGSSPAADNTSSSPAAATSTDSSPAADSTNGPAPAQESSPLTAKEQERQTKLDAFMRTGREIVLLKQKHRDASIDRKKKIEREIRNLVAVLGDKLSELIDADTAVGEISKDLQLDVSNAAQTSTLAKANLYSGLGGLATSAVGSGFKATGDNSFFSWGLDKNVTEQAEKLKNIQTAGDIISVVGATVSVISLVSHTIDFWRHSEQMTTGAKMMAGMDILSSAASTAKSMTGFIQGLAGATKDTINSVGGAIGIAAGSASVLTGGVDLYQAYKQKHRAERLEATFKGRENDSEPDSEEMRDSRKAANTARLTGRLADVRKTVAWSKMVTGASDIVGGALAVSGIGAGFGVLFTVFSGAVKLGVYLYKLYKKSGIIDQTIDDFIDTDSIYQDIIGDDQLDKDKEEDLKRLIRIKAAAKLGFCSRENLFNAITAKYALNIYMHVFYKKGSKTQLAENKDEADPDYIKLMKSLRLTPDYKKRKPDVNTIAYQLQNI